MFTGFTWLGAYAPNPTWHDGRLALNFAVAPTRYVYYRMEAQAWIWTEMGLSAVRGLYQTEVDDVISILTWGGRA